MMQKIVHTILRTNGAAVDHVDATSLVRVLCADVSSVPDAWLDLQPERTCQSQGLIMFLLSEEKMARLKQTKDTK